MVFRTNQPVPRGTELCISYLPHDLLAETPDVRQQALSDQRKGFSVTPQHDEDDNDDDNDDDDDDESNDQAAAVEESAARSALKAMAKSSSSSSSGITTGRNSNGGSLKKAAGNSFAQEVLHDLVLQKREFTAPIMPVPPSGSSSEEDPLAAVFGTSISSSGSASVLNGEGERSEGNWVNYDHKRASRYAQAAVTTNRDVAEKRKSVRMLVVGGHPVKVQGISRFGWSLSMTTCMISCFFSCLI